MRLRKIAVAAGAAALTLAAIAAAGFGWLRYAPRRTPHGQPALMTLDAERLPAFRDTFNAGSDATRVLVLFSPT
jgi:hypothetical protein